MKNLLPVVICLFTIAPALSQPADFPYKVSSTVLQNGLKVMVCEKPGNQFAQVEVWYRTGSKDEQPGIRGMAHLFEHMMFRGTKNYPKDTFDLICEKTGAENNAYTTFDRTVYYEYIPVTALELFLKIEADRMENLQVTQEILDVERQVVGEELRNILSNWYGKITLERYPFLYPAGHPYEVDVIGHLDEITAFTSEQCMNFYNNYYSPNNACLIVVGNVKSDEVFALAEKYFGTIKKQLDLKKKENVPDLFSNKIRTAELPTGQLVQIYSYIFPRPPFGDKDFFALNMLTAILFSDENSILKNRLMKKEYLAYFINGEFEEWNLYPNYGIFDIIMPSFPGNVKVRKIVREEINKIMAEGISQEVIDKFIQSIKAREVFSGYEAANIAARLGMAEYFFNDYTKAFSLQEQYKNITAEELKRVAAKYLSEDKIQIINIKPQN